MEPVTEFFNGPLLVLDFQSLYPSVMIAYNYCFSTCLGKARADPSEPHKFGVADLDIPPELLQGLKDRINVSPNGVMFVKSTVRKSLLARMLQDILDTRVMVKSSMKEYKNDAGLSRVLDARQLTLKYIANVTYGYTSATFSGRMPAVEIADSIVQTGRETLEKTIDTINSHAEWDARVVYGDTDSVFVYLPGRSRQEAFRIGNEIATTITQNNPAPVRLRFEKVYHPCILIAKKRYVGFKYEKPGEEVPEFEAKGIETVRRDGTPATQKILESSLKILFRTQNMSELKAYLYDQWSKILSDRVSPQDFIVSREVKLGTYTELPHGAQVAQAKMMQDPRAAPQYGERVPYLVVYRGPNAILKDRVVRPEALLSDSSLRLDAEYYIRKQIIPPLSRVFNLVGVDIEAWYNDMPRNLKAVVAYEAAQMSRIDQYYTSSHCLVCRKLCRTGQTLCQDCTKHPSETLYHLSMRQAETQKKLDHILRVCFTCSRTSPLDDTHPCDSLDCPVLYSRMKARRDVLATLTYDALDLEW
ncbi:hypothetical protein BCR43DRAFT_531657 [Syncephalastrum racemosum]|uniref:DNA polymerase zeta catalytic subunit n=1 Tax=Syncephalastrum racemosum TaxID=13706 RepID=A0A1X2HBB5_SYNRA|nr:hypothetical protein BCR43DRAFT_531657 [Syncephalastrum racemosum]